MGHSQHNKAPIGRRAALLNMKRVRFAACVTAFSGAAIAALVLASIK